MNADKAHGGGCKCLARRLLDNQLQAIYKRRGQTENNNTHAQDRKSGKEHLPFKLNSMLGSALVWRLCLREVCPRFGCVDGSAATSTSRSIGASKSGMGPLLMSKNSLFKNREKSS